MTTISNRVTPSPDLRHWASTAALASVVCAILLMASLHILKPELDPGWFNRLVVASTAAWLFTAAWQARRVAFTR